MNQNKSDGIRKTFENRRMKLEERLLVKVTNLKKLSHWQQKKMIGMFDFIQILKDKISKLEQEKKKNVSHYKLRKQRDEWERKYYDKCEELERWKQIKFNRK